MIRELDIVALNRAFPEHGLKAGAVGTVVIVHNDGEAFIVEFSTDTGELIALPTIFAIDVRPVQPGEITTPRKVA
jgi:ribulose-5-phosphate 4-epimerase/fuculose-1-phosphate aldolase